MQDKEISMQNNDQYAVSPNTQRLIEQLEELRLPQELSPEKLKHIIDFIAHFPEPYRAMGITKIAEYLVSNMGLHFLDIMATFQEKAQQEDIDQEECEGTFHDITEELFPIMMGLTTNVSVQSLEDLLTLSNITIGLYRLSRVDTAERAQRWLYKLPKLYSSQLAQEHLLASPRFQFTVTVHSIGMQPITGQPHLTLTVHPMTTQVVVNQSRLTVTLRSMPPQIVNSTIPDSNTTLVA